MEDEGDECLDERGCDSWFCFTRAANCELGERGSFLGTRKDNSFLGTVVFHVIN